MPEVKIPFSAAPLRMLAKPVAEDIKRKTLERVQRFRNRHLRAPFLAVVLVGSNPASILYTKKKSETADSFGIEHDTFKFDESEKPEIVQKCVEDLNKTANVDGILIQRPLPKRADQPFLESEVLYWIDPQKDVDGFHPENAGRIQLAYPRFMPCTPAGILELLKFYQISVRGKTACVIGRSNIVGKPMAMLLLQGGATLIHCHSETRDLECFTQQADILVVAMGKPEFINESHLKSGAVVIDVGINRGKDGRLVGDIAYESALRKVSAITPVPGGVGPMTIAMLLYNTVIAAELRMSQTK